MKQTVNMYRLEERGQWENVNADGGVDIKKPDMSLWTVQFDIYLLWVIKVLKTAYLLSPGFHGGNPFAIDFGQN